MHGVTTKKEKKLMQFVTLFHLLNQGRPSIKYEKSLYKFLKVPQTQSSTRMIIVG
jgi:hypothetical protein